MRRLLFLIILFNCYAESVLAYSKDLLQICKKSPNHKLYPKGDYLDTLILLEEVLANAEPLYKFCNRGFGPLGDKILEEQPCTDNLDVPSYIYLHPLRNNKYLLTITCDAGAYNQGDLYFLYDAKLAKNQRYLPNILIFPTASAYEPNKFFNTLTVNTRAVDTKHNLIYHFTKYTGGGYSGEYIIYKLAKNTFVPSMSKFVYNIDFIENGGDYQYRSSKIGEEPHGKQWHVLNLAPHKIGCIMPLKKIVSMTQKERDDIRCD